MKDQSIVLNVMSGDCGEILERTRNYCIRKEADGSIAAEFQNRTQEENAIKLTLTALKPGAVFQIQAEGMQGSERIRRANRAGILECRLPVPAGKQLTIRENTQE